jgi:drug/metabolite transporter (DMT)-like permease
MDPGNRSDENAVVFYATTFIFAAIIGLWTYGVPIRPLNLCGMALLIAGMYLMGR